MMRRFPPSHLLLCFCPFLLMLFCFALVERRAAQSPRIKGDKENAKHSDQAEVNAFERGGRKAFKLT